MKLRLVGWWLCGAVVVKALLLVACSHGRTDVPEPSSLERRGPFPLESFADLGLEWPRFFLALDRVAAEKLGVDYLWAEANAFIGLKHERERLLVVSDPIQAGGLAGMDEFIHGGATHDGRVAAIDAGGRIAVWRPGTTEVARLHADPGQRVGGIAVRDDRAHLLLQGDPQLGAAVVSLDLDGAVLRRWGRMPASGLVQGALAGGGITTCPDGVVYYNYLNDPRPFRYDSEARGHSRPLRGDWIAPFTRLSTRLIEDRWRESERTASVGPLVKAGVTVNRVIGLFCNEDGQLIRQVALPGQGHSRIELWDSATEEAIAVFNQREGTLLAAADHDLYFGSRSADGQFELRIVRFRLDGGS